MKHLKKRLSALECEEFESSLQQKIRHAQMKGFQLDPATLTDDELYEAIGIESPSDPQLERLINGESVAQVTALK